MLRHVRAAMATLVLLTLVTGVAYPLVVTGIAAAAFPRQAGGSLIVRGGRVAGSRLLGQPFDDPRYFWGRLSATSPLPYTAFNADKGTGSTGSNLGPLNPALVDAAKARIQALRDADRAAGVSGGDPVPVDLVTSSASGLDPHVSPAAASFQADRVARVRGIPRDRVYALIASHTEGPQFGILGEPRVNVLELNLALDEVFPVAPPPAPPPSERAPTATAPR